MYCELCFFFSKVFHFLPQSVIKILDTHDRLSDRKVILEKQGLNSDFFFTSQREENIALNRSDIVLSISKDEADYFRKNTTSTVLWLGHKHSKISLEQPTRSSETDFKKGKNKIWFYRSKNQVNTKSIFDFVAFASNKWAETSLNFELVIAGRCSEVLENFQNVPWLKLQGPVDNVEQFYKSLDCIIIPLFLELVKKLRQ